MISLESVYVLASTEAKLYRQCYCALSLACVQVIVNEAEDAPNHAARKSFVRRFRDDPNAFKSFALWLSLALALNEEIAEHLPDNVPDQLVMAAVADKFDLLVSFAQEPPSE